jgi:hypothetical protein
MGHRIGRTSAVIMVGGRESGLQGHGNAFVIAAMLRSIPFYINDLHQHNILVKLGSHYCYCNAT